MIILCSLLFITSCSDDSSCTDGSIEVTNLDDLGCTNSAFNLTVATLNDFELIRNQSDYDSFINSKCNPDIDWLKYDLIAGMVGLTRGLSSIDEDLVMNCTANRLILTIHIRVNITQEAPIVSFNALIPKLKDDQDFFVDIKVTE